MAIETVVRQTYHALTLIFIKDKKVFNDFVNSIRFVNTLKC